MAKNVNVRATIKMFGGIVKQISHDSVQTRTPMNVSVFLPPQAAHRNVPALYWLSGLTCTDENFLTKAGAQKRASELGIALIMPDTSPRGANIEGEDESYDFGSGAGFYCDAVRPKWRDHYRMYSYVTEELPQIVEEVFPAVSATTERSIFGHSMGGHGALICALKNPGMYKSVSAFAPISNPIACPWGQKAFAGYIGDDVNEWKQYDATELVSAYEGPELDILIDQGDADNFYMDGQLLPEHFAAACDRPASKARANLRMQEGYDHSYYFIATFMDDHIEHHAKSLLG